VWGSCICTVPTSCPSIFHTGTCMGILETDDFNVQKGVRGYIHEREQVNSKDYILNYLLVANDYSLLVAKILTILYTLLILMSVVNRGRH
jgi:hypothetical protein